MRVAYIVSRFPSTTETFIAREMQAAEELGVDVELFSIIRARNVVVHPEARPFMTRLRTAPLWSTTTWASQWYWLRRRPRAYLRALVDVARANARAPGFLLRAGIVFPMAARFAREAAEEGVEHVHAHWATHPALAAYVVQRLARIPYSFTAHAHDIFVNRTMLDEKVAAACFVAVISEFNRDYLVAHCGTGVGAKIEVIRCGVDPTRYTPPAHREPTSRGDGCTIVCVASLQPYKGHRVLVDALARLRDRGVAFECLLVGDGPLRAGIADRVRALHLTDRVELLGARSSDDVLDIVRSADIAVLPSVVADDGQMEGVPVALMEALACEIPVVAPRLSGIPELVIDGNNGLLVEPGDPVALAEALEVLASDPDLRRRLGRAGRTHVLASFDARENARMLVACFSR